MLINWCLWFRLVVVVTIRGYCTTCNVSLRKKKFIVSIIFLLSALWDSVASSERAGVSSHPGVNVRNERDDEIERKRE